MSRSIELHTSLDVPAGLAHAELAKLMLAIHEHRAPFEKAALRVGLHDLRLPSPGEISVPIEAGIMPEPVRYACAINIGASEGGSIFPKFEGTISVSPLGSSACELWLQEEYTTPFGGVGEAIDATLLSGAAKRSLSGFLEFLADNISGNVRKAQEAEVRGRLGRSGA